MPTFIQSQTVAAGDPLKASQMASLAAAFNSRLTSGVGDCVWRIAYYLHSGLVRQLRNSDGAYSFPPDAEFWNIYQHVNPNDAQYPLTGPGDPEGANLANIINSFVYGGEAVGLDSEAQRLSEVPTTFADGDPMTPARYWLLAKQQRGAYDPNTGGAAWPAGTAARAYAYIRQSLTSPHGNAWGGWIPFPTDGGGCADPDDYNPQIVFTNLNTGAVLNYTTNCPEDPNAIAIAYSPFQYVLFHGSGAITILPKNEWIEGPYEDNAQLRKTQAEALGRVLNHYASEFRGTPEQGGGKTNANAFDLERFLTTQYPLAPNVGVQIGNFVSDQYPSWRSFDSGIDGQAFGYVTGGAHHVWLPGTVCTGFLIASSGIEAECVIAIEEDGVELARFTIPAGDHEELYWLPEARRLSSIRVRHKSAMTASPGGGILVEGTELLEMKPQVHDYYLVTRLSYYGASGDQIDGRGIDCEQAKQILERLYEFGAVTPLSDSIGFGVAADPVLNQNAVYDAARRFTQYVRIIPRWNLTGYAVQGGKSVLWFNRTAYGPPGFPSRDMFAGIGPGQEEIINSPIKWGREYIVTSGQVTYNGTTYNTGQRFTGINGLSMFDGGGKVKEYDGIKLNAEPADWSNEWALTLTLKPYRESVSSIWKTEAYGDVLSPFLNRCHIDAPEIDTSDTYNLHEAFGAGALAPEAPSGFNYGRVRDSTIPGATHINKRNCGGDPTCEAENVAFYKSCRIFEPPLEIESAVMDGADLKVTLNGRLHHHGLAPASIARDVTGWDINDLRIDEDYRTHENGIREYLVWQHLGINASNKIGDIANNSTLMAGGDTPFGSVLPTFILCKLVPTPYLDGNDESNPHDSPTTHDQMKQAELYLRAMCEGFVDGVTTPDVACRTGSVSAYDYTYPNLMFQASGNRWVPLLPSEVRPDNPFGFGPLPNTKFYSDTFNALAEAVNLLTVARIMLPSEIEHRLITGTAAGSINVRGACGESINCNALTSGTFVYGSANLPAGASVAEAWNPGYINGSGFGTNLVQSTDYATACDGDKWRIESARSDMQIRWVLTDPDSYNALPGNLGSLLDSDSVAAMSLTTTITTWRLAYGTIDDAGTNSSGFCGDRPAGSEYAYFPESITSSTVCGGMTGIIRAPHVSGLVGIAYESSSEVATAGPSSSTGPDVYEDGTALVRIPAIAYTGGS